MEVKITLAQRERVQDVGQDWLLTWGNKVNLVLESRHQTWKGAIRSIHCETSHTTWGMSLYKLIKRKREKSCKTGPETRKNTRGLNGKEWGTNRTTEAANRCLKGILERIFFSSMWMDSLAKILSGLYVSWSSLWFWDRFLLSSRSLIYRYWSLITHIISLEFHWVFLSCLTFEV